MQRKTFAYLLTILILIVAACTPSEPTITTPATNDNTTSTDGSAGDATTEPDLQVTPTDPQDDVVLLPPSNGQSVYVDSLDVMIMESFPVQVSVLVRGNLANPCVTLNGISAERADQTFTLTFDTTVDTDAICTAVLTPFEQTVALDVEELSADTYTIVGAQQEATFTLDMDNSAQTETDEATTDVVEPTPESIAPTPEVIGGALDGTNWQLSWGESDGQSFSAFGDIPISLIFADGGLSGNAGCNSYFGDYTLTGEVLTIGVVGATMMACDPDIMQIEQQYLDALAKARLVAINGDRLTITLESGSLHFSNAQPIEKMIFVGPEQVDCMGMVPQKCLLVRDVNSAEWEYFFDSIAGFEWEAGFEYELRVRVSPIENPPADGSSVLYELIEVVSKTEVQY